MKKYKFIEAFGLSNFLGISKTSYKFSPDKTYDYDETMKEFIDKFPDRFSLIEDDVISVEISDNITKEEAKIFVESKAKEIAKEVNEIVNEDPLPDILSDDIPDTEKEDTDNIIIDEELPKKDDVDSKEVYLNELHWTKIKKLAEKFEIKYTTRDETVKELKKLDIKKLIGE